MSKIVSQLDADGVFVSAVRAFPSPLEPGVWNIPAGAVDAPPPEVPAGKLARWTGDGWDFEDVPSAPEQPEPTVEERRAARWEQVKGERSRRVVGGVEVGGYWYHTDIDSRIQHLQLSHDADAVLAAGGSLSDPLEVGGQPVLWKTMSNDFVPMTVGLAREIVEAIKLLNAQAFARAEALRVAIYASDNPEAVDISAGWPPIFEE